MRVLHVITSLHAHGAQRMMVRLIERSQSEKLTHAVVALSNEDALIPELRSMGVPVQVLGLNSLVEWGSGIVKLRKILDSGEHDLVQSWLYHSDLLTGLLAARHRQKPLVWNVRSHYPSVTDIPFRLRWILRMLAVNSSRWPRAIVTNSEAARLSHIALGYSAQRLIRIPNGIDCERFKPMGSARASLRSTLKLPNKAEIIGMVARDNPQKDFANFFSAAALVLAKHPNCHFVLCGDGIDSKAWSYGSLEQRLGLSGRIHRLGSCSDLPALYSGFTVATLTSSFGESFPNVVAESMSCGVPTVATDVGDAALILGEPHWVVPARNAQMLADRWSELLSLTDDARLQWGLRHRKRIESEFSMAAAVTAYQSLWAALLKP